MCSCRCNLSHVLVSQNHDPASGTQLHHQLIYCKRMIFPALPNPLDAHAHVHLHGREHVLVWCRMADHMHGVLRPCTLICTDLSSAVRLRSAPWHMSFGEDGNRPSLSEPRRAWEQTTDEREQLGRGYTFEGNKGHCGFWWWWGDDIGLVEGLIITSGWLTPGFNWVS